MFPGAHHCVDCTNVPFVPPSLVLPSFQSGCLSLEWCRISPQNPPFFIFFPELELSFCFRFFLGGNFFFEVMPRQIITKLDEKKTKSKEKPQRNSLDTMDILDIKNKVGSYHLHDLGQYICAKCHKAIVEDEAEELFFELPEEQPEFGQLRSKSLNSLQDKVGQIGGNQNGESWQDSSDVIIENNNSGEEEDELDGAGYDLLSGTEFGKVNSNPGEGKEE